MDAVKVVGVVPVADAVDGDALQAKLVARAARLREAGTGTTGTGREIGEDHEIPAVQRQIVDRLAGAHIAQFRALRLEQRTGRFHGYRFVDGAGLEREIEPWVLIDIEIDVLDNAPEAFVFDSDGKRAGRERWRGVVSIRAGLESDSRVGLTVANTDGRAGNQRAG